MKNSLIVSPEVTSFANHFIGCGIDKLVLRLTHTLRLHQCRKHIENYGYRIIEKKNRQNKTNLLFQNDEFEIYGFGYQRGSGDWEIMKITFKGNMFENEDEMFAELINLFGEDILFAKIARIDVNFDFNLKFNELLKGIDIKHKYKRFEYLSYSGELTSIRHGDEDSIKVYNRSRLLSSDQDLSRVEFAINMTSYQLPFNDYVKALKTISELPIMNHVEFIETEMPFKLAIDLYDKDFKKFIQFFCLYEKYGFTQAKKVFNRNSNFHRDFNKIVGRKIMSFNLKNVFNQNFALDGGLR